MSPMKWPNKFCSLVLIIVLSACGTQKLNRENFSGQLEAPDKKLQVDITAVRTDSSAGMVYFSLPSSSLLFTNSGDGFTSTVAVTMQMYASFKSDVVADTVNKEFQFDQSQPRLIIDSIPFRWPQQQGGVLKISVTDINRKTSVIKLVTLTANDVNLLVCDTNNIPLARNFTESFRKVFIRDYKGKRNLFVRAYYRDYPVASPPFRESKETRFNYRPDSMFMITTDTSVSFERQGIYHIQEDTSVKRGFTVFVFDQGFPEVRSPLALAQPLRYITTGEEYKSIITSSDLKAASDRFWLNAGGRADRAKALIRIYYQRVQEANRQFTSYHEGWKTDRGMIYIIFGTPETVYRDGELERWIYSARGAMPGFSFDFNKIADPFTENDFSLGRSLNYETLWFRAVESWRNGNVSLSH